MSECDHVWRMRDGLGADGYHHVCAKCEMIHVVTSVSSAMANLTGPTDITATVDPDCEMTINIGTDADDTGPRPGNIVHDG